MAVGKKETLIARTYLSPNGYSKHKVPAMAAAKVNGIKRVERNAKQLTDLMERFHTLSGFYEAKRDSFRKEHTFHEMAGASVKAKVTEVGAADVAKPVPPLAQGRPRKLSLKKSEAKLHSGIGVGIGVFRLKDTLVGGKVLQSVPQDDVMFSFHQPRAVQGEGSLYQEAIASSRKYVLANGGDIARQAPADLPPKKAEKSATNRHNDDNGAAVNPVDKANTIGDFNLANKRRHKQKRSFPQPQAMNNISSTKDKTNAQKGKDTRRGESGEAQKCAARGGQASEKELVGERPNGLRDSVTGSKVAGRRKKTKPLKPTSSPSTAVLVDFSVPTSLKDAFVSEKGQQEENLEKRKDKPLKNDETELEDSVNAQPTMEKIPTFLKMPKFVRTNEEMFPTVFEKKNSVNSVLPESRLDMSASSYYISTHPKKTASPSSLQSIGGRSRYSPDAKTSTRDCYSRTETPRKLNTIVSPLPSSESKKFDAETHLEPLVRRGYEPRTSKEKASDVKKQLKRPLARKQGRIKEVVDQLKDPQLETLIQGRCFTQNVTGDPPTAEQIEVKGGSQNSEDKKSRRREKSKSGGSNKKAKDSLKKEEKEDSKLPVFNAYESFVIKSKHHVPPSARTSPDASELKASKLPQKFQGKLAPLMKSNTELTKSNFILARTDRNIGAVNESPVRLVSDPITFSVRHPPHASSCAPASESPHVNKPPRDLLLGRMNGFHDMPGEKERTVVVFFHHDDVSGMKNKDLVLHTHPRYSAIYKSTLTPTKEEASGSDQLSFSNSTKVGSQQCLEKTEITESQSSIESVTKRARKKRKGNPEELLNHVSLKNTGPGGFKANAAQYSMLLRQHRLFKDDQETFLRLMRDDLLRNQSPEVAFGHSLPRPAASRPKIPPGPDLELSNPTKLATMLKKFAHASPDANQRPTGYTMFTAAYPIKHDDAVEHLVHTHDPKRTLKKATQSSIRLNYVWPDATKRFPFLAANPTKFPTKSLGSRSTGSDASSTKSLKITDLNFELNPDERGRQFFMPKLSYAPLSNKSQEKHMEADCHLQKQPHYMMLTLPQINRTDLIKEEEVEDEGFENLDSYLCIDADTASILPDPGTTSYRLTHDVSFDEGSRYRTADFPHGLKGNGDPRGQLGSMNTLSHHFAATASKRNSESVAASSQPRHEGRIGAGRDHGSQSKHSFKDSFSLLRMEDRCDLPPTTSPPSSAIPSAIAAPPSTSSFMPPPSASQRSNATNATSGGGNITFRLNKGKQNWNYKLGNLSINGGGYPNQSPLVPNPKQEVDSINPMNLISAVQRNLQTRERAVATGAKSRSAMRYGNKTDSANAPNYADPCIAAAPSFQQRLTDLSILESETIKYERNRKSRRKKNQDKDS